MQWNPEHIVDLNFIEYMHNIGWDVPNTTKTYIADLLCHEEHRFIAKNISIMLYTTVCFVAEWNVIEICIKNIDDNNQRIIEYDRHIDKLRIPYCLDNMMMCRLSISKR